MLQLSALELLLRLGVASLCGGLIGIERGRKHRAAGFRTYMLVCMGAALTMVLGTYLAIMVESELWHLDPTANYAKTDVSRFGAQVINGIGFIGAGTIIITKRRQVKGLTTAAGLWAAAIVGLCCGAGFFEGAVLATLIILMAELVFAKLEYYIVSNSRVMNLYVEYASSNDLGSIVDTVKKTGAFIVDMEISKSSGEDAHPCVIVSIQKPRKISSQALMAIVAKQDGVVSVEEL